MGSDLLANALVRNGLWEANAIDANELMPMLSRNIVDLVVIGADVASNQGSGFDLAFKMCQSFPAIPILILLNFTSHSSVIDAFRSGARGVFTRQQSMSEFLDCVEHVRKGYVWARKQEADVLLQALRSIPAPSIAIEMNSPALTSRELEVVQCAAKGQTNKAIANELGLSEHTVKNYLFRAFEKLGVSSRVELLFYLTTRDHASRENRLVGEGTDSKGKKNQSRYHNRLKAKA